MITSMHGARDHCIPPLARTHRGPVALEMIHPDAALGEEYGKFGEVDTAYIAGKGAMEAAKLPPKIHVRGTHEGPIPRG